MTDEEFRWLSDLWFGDGRPSPYGLLTSQEPAQADGRTSRQQRRLQTRKAAKDARR